MAGPCREAGPGYALDVENLFVMDVEFCTGIDERLDLPVVLPPTLDVVDLTGADVLVADDVADTGKALQLVRELCAGSVSSVRTAVVHEPQSVVRCDYVWRRTDRSPGAGRAPPVAEPSIRSASTGPATIVHPVPLQALDGVDRNPSRESSNSGDGRAGGVRAARRPRCGCPAGDGSTAH